MSAIGKLRMERECAATENPGRLGAGENPAKRDQILDGAGRVFASDGYDGASMNDITRAAGVSKGTIYVYFNNKEELFAALVMRERERMFNAVASILDPQKPLQEVLYDFGMMFARHMSSPGTIRGMRMVLGVIDKLPEVAQTFLNCGPTRGAHLLKDYLSSKVDEGLLEIEEPLLAARQFADLCSAGLFKPALFGELGEQPSDEELAVVVKSALRVFMKAYGARQPQLAIA